MSTGLPAHVGESTKGNIFLFTERNSPVEYLPIASIIPSAGNDKVVRGWERRKFKCDDNIGSCN